MGKQYNKLIKRRRRNAYNVRKKLTLAEKTKVKARPAKKASAPAAPVAPVAAPTAAA